MHRMLWLGFICLVTTSCQASVELTSHSYVHRPSGQVHVVFHLASYKTGLFFGSCGPSFRSLQWEYTIELKGDGPGYSTKEVELRDGNFRVLALDSGSVRMDPKKHTATISLVVKRDLAVQPFAGNGTYRIKQGH